MNGVEMIAAERQRQISEEGHSAEHDDDHNSEQLAAAAACYATPARFRHLLSFKRIGIWPWIGEFKPDPLDRKHDLVRAGALIAAELDRLLRAEAREG